MEPEDTVMSDYKVLEAGLKNPTHEKMHGKHCPLSWIRVAEAQAEISFPLGKQAGIKEGTRRAYEFMKKQHYIVDYDLDRSVEYLEKVYGKPNSKNGS